MLKVLSREAYPGGFTTAKLPLDQRHVNASFTKFRHTVSMVLTVSTRELSLEIAYNVRHLGGYATRQGKATQDGAIRSAGLHRLTEVGVASLADTGVRTVVDLRSAVEREAAATPETARFGITNIAAPVFEQDASPVGLTTDDFPGFATVYERMLVHGAEAYHTLFGVLADSEGRVVFHCAAGKDRTGVAAALLLDLLDVPDETIVDDYTRSAELLSPMLQEWLPSMRERGMSVERAEKLMQAQAPDMVATLAHIRKHYGSSEGYLSSIGVVSGQISTLRARYAS